MNQTAKKSASAMAMLLRIEREAVRPTNTPSHIKLANESTGKATTHHKNGTATLATSASDVKRSTIAGPATP